MRTKDKAGGRELLGGGRELLRLGPLFEFASAIEAEEARLLAKDMERAYSIHRAHEMDETSLDTYEAIKAALPARRAAVLAELEGLGGEASAEELADRLGWDKSHCMPRITELRKQGLIRKAGRTRATRAGKSENIWRLK